MEQFGLENIRNLALLSHAGAGKTSLAEAVLFTTGAINRLGKVDEGTTTSDYDPIEVKRRISINLSVLPCQWQKTKINLLDTPGYSDFVAEVKAAIKVSEGALISVCAASGVEVGTEQVWDYSEEAGLPRLVIVNKMDRENADFKSAVKELQDKFGTKCVPVQLPIGAHTTFTGIIDLLTRKSFTGTAAKEGEVPAALQNEVNSLREKLVESITEGDDTMLERYLGGEELSVEELDGGLRRAVLAGRIVPVLAGSALQNIGISLLLNSICRYLPSPKERKVALVGESGKVEMADPDPNAPAAALVFKTTADPYVGKLTYFRVYRGVIGSNSHVWNSTRGEPEHIGQLYLVHGKTQEPVTQVRTGDIGAVAKLNFTNTGDTLCTREKPVKLAPIVFPKPSFSESVSPKTKNDLDKLGPALTRLVEEDPTLHLRHDLGTGETILSGIGEVQLAVAAEKMLRKFGVGVELKTPKVPYKETITISADAEYKHKKQTGGHGQYGHVILKVEPLTRNSGMHFESKVVGGRIPTNFIPAIEKGVHEAIHEGVLAGYPVTDIRVSICDGSFHPVDSSEICFKIAGAGALKKGLTDGKPIILEPVVNLTVRVPEEYTGEIIGDLNTKRAHVHGMNPENGINTIEARVPLAEIQRYAIDLKSKTQGRGSFTTEFSHYQETPQNVVQKIVAERQALVAAHAAKV
ncbi:MAG: elongation factor G [Dehalococcoidales bacterium]|nr:elongation factor G [Dehalococcoidales bacterium]